MTLREIGEKYGISRERVRQIEERVKKKLKTYLKDIKDVNDVVWRPVALCVVDGASLSLSILASS